MSITAPKDSFIARPLPSAPLSQPTSTKTDIVFMVFLSALNEIQQLTSQGHPRLYTAPMLEEVMEALRSTDVLDPHLARECFTMTSHLLDHHGEFGGNPHALSSDTYLDVARIRAEIGCLSH